jgi:hypothetical protein
VWHTPETQSRIIIIGFFVLLQFGAADVVRSNTATVTAGGDLMLIPRWAVKEVELM